jgi:hypothetical protein
LDAAYKWYQMGHDTGLKEPDIKPARQDLWNFRWEHAKLASPPGAATKRKCKSMLLRQRPFSTRAPFPSKRRSSLI